MCAPTETLCHLCCLPCNEGAPCHAECVGKVTDAPAFETEAEAWGYLLDPLYADGESCIDNHRFAYLDDAAGMAEYEEADRSGCCGRSSAMVQVGGRLAVIGCNYGH